MTTAAATDLRPPARTGGYVLPLPVRWLWRVVVVVVLAASLLVLAATVVVPRIAGATPYTILTGSMQPKMPPGTLVVVKPVDPADISVGDVVTYQLRSGQDAVVTHRVVAVGVTSTGELSFTTRGDANGVADAAPVRPEQVRGVAWYAVPELGRLSTVAGGGQRQLLVYLVAAGLVAYGISMVAGGARDRRERRLRVEATTVGPDQGSTP